MQVQQLPNEVKAYGGLAAMPGYQLYEYQLAISIPDALREKVRRHRQQIQEKFLFQGGKQNAILLPLVKFKQRQLLEERLRHGIYELVTAWRPFMVQLKDFKALPSHTVYIPVSNNSVLQQHVKSLKTMQSLFRSGKEQLPFYFQDHKLVVAAGMPHGVFEKVWMTYSAKHFTGQFLASSCLLLKRQVGTSNWQIAQRFEFRDLPVGVKQGSLFS